MASRLQEGLGLAKRAIKSVADRREDRRPWRPLATALSVFLAMGAAAPQRSGDPNERLHTAARVLVVLSEADRRDKPELISHYREEIEAALGAGADIDSVDRDGHTVLYTAQGLNFERSWTVEVVERLLDLGATVDLQLDGIPPGGSRQSIAGRTALMRAVERGAVPFVELLLDRGADPTLADAGGCDSICRALVGAEMRYPLPAADFEALALRLAGSRWRVAAGRFGLWRRETLPRKIPTRRELRQGIVIYGLPGLPLLAALLFFFFRRPERRAVHCALLTGWVATWLLAYASIWIGRFVVGLGWMIGVFLVPIWLAVCILGIIVALVTLRIVDRRPPI